MRRNRVRLAGAALVLAVSLPAAARSEATAPPRAPDPMGFAVTFAPRSEAPALEGAPGAANAAAMRRIGSALAAMASALPIRMILVGRKPASCTADQHCDANDLTFRRVRAIRAALAAAAIPVAPGAEPVFRAFAFDTDLRPQAVLPPEPTGGEALHLRIEPAAAPRPSPECPWSLQLIDPDLPPVIGAEQHVPAIVATGSRELAAGPQARVAVRPEVDAGVMAGSAWQTGAEEFRATSGALLSRGGEQPPGTTGTLHLVVARRNHPVMALIGQLQPASRSNPELARLLPGGEQLGTRNIGDQVYPVDGQVIVQSRAELHHCAIALKPRVPP